MSRRKQKHSRNARSSPEMDRHALYEASVQCTEADVKFFDRVYKKRHGRKPHSLREDFCGTGALAVDWVRARPENTAIGVDLDQPTIDWGMERHVAPLGDGTRGRVQFINANVLDVVEPKVDIVAAMNFSYFIFKTRDDLRRYFEVVRSSLAPGGIFILDIFGGWEAQALEEEEKEQDGFTYYWDQESFDPITNETVFSIHFQLDDGTWMKKAFSYDWRLWSLAEVRELLAEAGFSSSEVYWEGTDRKTGEGNGVFRAAENAESCPGWIAYIVADQP